MTIFFENIWKNCWKMENCAAHNIILAKCGLEFCIEFVKFSFAAAFHIVFLLNLVNLKKHRLRLWILELKFFEFPALRQYFFVICNLKMTIGEKNTIAIEFNFENDYSKLGFGKIWINNEFIGSEFDLIPYSYIISILEEKFH